MAKEEVLGLVIKDPTATIGLSRQLAEETCPGAAYCVIVLTHSPSIQGDNLAVGLGMTEIGADGKIVVRDHNVPGLEQAEENFTHALLNLYKKYLEDLEKCEEVGNATQRIRKERKNKGLGDPSSQRE